MNWQAVGAISTAFTGVVILFTVIYAARQVQVLNEQAKATAEQIEHLRKSTQLEGMHEAFNQLLTAEFTDALNFILSELPERLKDETYHRETLTRGESRLPNHKEFIVFRTFESIGTCVKWGMIEGGPLYDFASPTIIESWDALAGLVAEQRQAWNIPGLWENFEALYLNAKERGFGRTT
jgi:hypothetical protein